MGNAERRSERGWRAVVHVALWTLAGVAAIELAWLALFAWAEGSGRLRSWMNRRPEKASVEYSTASSLWPGLVEVSGLVVRGRTERGIDWEVEAAGARLQLDLLPLVLRTVRVRGAEIAGLAVRTRQPVAEGEAPSPHAPRLRPMPAPGPSTAGGTGSSTAPRRRTPKWSLELRHLRVADLRELVLDEYAVSGPIAGEAGFAVRMADGEAEIFDSHLELGGVTVSRRGEAIARDLAGELRLALSPYRYKEERGRALVPHTSGRVRLTGELDARPVVAELLSHAPWLEIEAGVSPLDADLRLADGRLLSGSRLHADLGRQRVRALDFEIDGEAALDLAVGGAGRPSAEARWRVGFAEFSLRRSDLPQPLLVGRGLSVGGTSADGDLAQFAESAPLGLDLGEARLPDLGFLAEWLPPGARIEQLEGSAVVGGHLEATIADRKPSGTLDAKFDRLTLRWAGDEFAGRLEVHLAVAGGDLEARRLELDGSKLLLADFAAPLLESDHSAATRGWWMSLQLPRGAIGLGPPVTFDGEFAARFKDTAPLVALFETRRDLPRWAERVLTDEDVRASGKLRAGLAELVLEDLQTELLGGKLSMRLRFAGESRRGKLLIAWQRLAIGAGFDGARREIRIDDAREWFAGD